MSEGQAKVLTKLVAFVSWLIQAYIRVTAAIVSKQFFALAVLVVIVALIMRYAGWV